MEADHPGNGVLIARLSTPSELLGYGRDPLAPIKDAVTADGDVVVPIDAEAFGFWLKAAFGEPIARLAAIGNPEKPLIHILQVRKMRMIIDALIGCC